MTRSPFDSHAILRSCVQELDPHATKAHVYSLLRGGLPGASSGDGRGSAEPASPGSGFTDVGETRKANGDADYSPVSFFDRTDSELLAARDWIDERLDFLATEFAKVIKRQRDLLWEKPRPKDKEAVRADLRESLKQAIQDEEAAEDTNDEKLIWLRGQLAAVEEPTSQPSVPLKWCSSCARVKVNGSQHHSPVADEKKGGKNGVLCRWCTDFAREHGGQWPDIEMVRARAEGRRVLVKVKQ